MNMNNSTTTNILTDQPTDVSTSTNAKHIGIGVGIAILVLTVVGAMVFGVFALLRRRRWTSRRRGNSRGRRPNNGKRMQNVSLNAIITDIVAKCHGSRSASHQLPSLETRMTNATTLPLRNKTWGSYESTKSLEELVKKPEPAMAAGDDTRV
jgi:hypothetical protein